MHPWMCSLIIKRQVIAGNCRKVLIWRGIGKSVCTPFLTLIHGTRYKTGPIRIFFTQTKVVCFSRRALACHRQNLNEWLSENLIRNPPLKCNNTILLTLMATCCKLKQKSLKKFITYLLTFIMWQFAAHLLRETRFSIIPFQNFNFPLKIWGHVKSRSQGLRCDVGASIAKALGTRMIVVQRRFPVCILMVVLAAKVNKFNRKKNKCISSSRSSKTWIRENLYSIMNYLIRERYQLEILTPGILGKVY